MNEFETPCLCFARDARLLEPEQYRWAGGVLWGIWQECPTHGEHFMSPVWTARTGQLKNEPAAAVEAVPVELETLERA